MPQQTSQQQDKIYVFLDTCILQYLGDKNKSKAETLQKCLDSLIKDKYTLVVSEISLYEHMQGLWGAKAQKAFALLNIYEWKSVTTIVLLWATYLGGLYHDEKIDGVDTGDKIIAATAVSENGFILTSNHKDYPHPFFVTEKAFALSYSIGKFSKTLDVVLYKPNLSLLVRRLDEKMQQ